MPRVVGALFMTMNSWAPWRTARTRREKRKIEIRAQKKKNQNLRVRVDDVEVGGVAENERKKVREAKREARRERETNVRSSERTKKSE